MKHKDTFTHQPIVDAVIEKLRTVPSGTVITTSMLLNSLFVYRAYNAGIYYYKGFRLSTEEYFEIHSRLRQQAHKENVRLCDYKYAGMTAGLPFNTPYVVLRKEQKASSNMSPNCA